MTIQFLWRSLMLLAMISAAANTCCYRIYTLSRKSPHQCIQVNSLIKVFDIMLFSVCVVHRAYWHNVSNRLQWVFSVLSRVELKQIGKVQTKFYIDFRLMKLCRPIFVARRPSYYQLYHTSRPVCEGSFSTLVIVFFTAVKFPRRTMRVDFGSNCSRSKYAWRGILRKSSILILSSEAQVLV